MNQNQAISRLNTIKELIESKDIIRNDDGKILKLVLNNDYKEIQDRSFFSIVRKGKPFRIYTYDFLLVLENAPRNGKKYTQLDIVDFWLNSLFSDSLRNKFYYFEDGSIDFSTIAILFHRILQMELKISSALLVKKYNGLYHFCNKVLKKTNEYGETLEQFVTGTLKIPINLYEYSENDIFLKNGKIWDEFITREFSCFFKDFKKHVNIWVDNKKYTVDGTLQINNLSVGIDFKLKILSDEKIKKSKEFTVYREKYNKFFLLYLFGPREVKLITEDFISMHVLDFILENSILLNEKDRIQEIINKIENFSKDIELNPYKPFEEDRIYEIFHSIQGCLEKGVHSAKLISEELNLNYDQVYDILSGRRYKDNASAIKIQRLYEELRRNKELNAKFFAFNSNGKRYGPFSNIKQCIEQLNSEDPYSKICGIEPHGVERSKNNKGESYKGYCFIKAGELEDWKNTKMKDDLAKANKKLNEDCSKIMVFKEGTLISIYSSLQIAGENLKLLPSDLSNSIVEFRTLMGLNFYRIAPRTHTHDEIQYYLKNGVCVNTLLELLIDNVNRIIGKNNAPSRNMNENDMDNILRSILEQLNKGITSFTEIAKYMGNNPIVEPIIKGSLYNNHPFSCQIKDTYKRLKANEKQVFYSFDYLGNRSGPFKDIDEFIKKKGSDILGVNAASIKRVLNQGKDSRSNYYGYIFIYENDLSIISNEDLQMRINKAKDSFDSKYGTYLVIKIIEGQEVYKIYDTLNELALVEKIPRGETTRKHINSNKEYKGMWLFRLSPKKYSEKEKSSFMQKNINLVDLLAIISSLKEFTEESI